MLPEKSNIARLLSSTTAYQQTVFFVKKQIIFSHGDRSDSIFYIKRGTVKLTVTSSNGKEALIGSFGGGHFIGENCLVTNTLSRFHTATALTDVQTVRIGRGPMIRMLRTNAELAFTLIRYLLRHNAQIQEI